MKLIRQRSLFRRRYDVHTSASGFPAPLKSPDCQQFVCKQSRPTSSAMDRQEGDDHAAEEERHVGEHAEEELDAFAVSTESLLAASDDVEVEEEAHGGTQSSHRLLAYSDALLSIIATVMVRQ